ncbi:MAG TPA: hypothetical protein C5S37_00870 [Methanophagales archaeon]|nr:hypothetical protein [Methanophagales archaeon]
MPQVRFEVKSILGKEIRTTEEYWKLISEVKHPIIRRYEEEVNETIKNPDEVRRSKKDFSVFLYYKKYGNLFICVLVRHLNNEGYIITAYIADKMKKGDVIWQKKS